VYTVYTGYTWSPLTLLLLLTILGCFGLDSAGGDGAGVGEESRWVPSSSDEEEDEEEDEAEEEEEESLSAGSIGALISFAVTDPSNTRTVPSYG
jgi:hypothetical protein